MTTKRSTPTKFVPPMPVEFTGNLSDLAKEALYAWLRAAGAPPEVAQLVEHLVLLEQYYHYVEVGDERAVDLLSIEETVATTAQAMVTLGGVFEGGGCVSNRRDDVPGFQPPDDGRTVAQRIQAEWAKEQMQHYFAPNAPD